MLRATISLGEPALGPVVERGFKVTWEPPGTPEPEVRLKTATAADLGVFIDAVRSGAIDFEMIRKAAPALGYLLGSNRLNGADPVDLAAEGPTTALTELPWEAAQRGSGPLPDDTPVHFERLLASLPICRLVPASSRLIDIAKYRPRLLLCISNPPGIDGGQIAVGLIQTACDQALQPYPVFQVKKLGGPLIWSTVSSIIHSFRPNILIVVGHGSSDPAGGNPTLAFVRDGDPGGVNRVPVADLAEALAAAGSCCLVALVACDLVRASGHSAACELVRQGVGEVVAMQGSIQQHCARVILEALLSEVLAGASLPSAAAAARRAAKDHPHAILPAVFRASDRSPGASELAPLSVLYSRAVGNLYARASETRPMLERETLRKRVEEILAGTGVAAVGGAFGSGSSTLLRAAVASLLAEPVGRKSRPVLYIDCDRRLGHLSLSEWVSDQLRGALAANSVLRPMNSPDFTGYPRDGYEAGVWAVEAEISVVLDNLPFHPRAEDKAFVERFSLAYKRPDTQACLVLGGAGELLELPHVQATVAVQPLSLPETERYANDFVPGANGQELYRLTGGTLLLLDAERRVRTPPGRARTMFEGNGSTIELYLERLEEWLSPEAREAATRLALFPYPIDVRLANEFVTPDLPGAIEALLNAGLVMSFEDNTITWLVIPERKSRGIQTRRADDREGTEAMLAKKFFERYDGKEDAVVREVTSFAGASEYLKVVQRFLAASGWSDVAVFLPLRAQGTPLHANGLFALFKQAIQVLDGAGVTDAKTFLAGSRAALNIGESEIAELWFGRIPEKLDRTNECRRLGLKAAILKDKRQASALPEILECFSKTTELMKDVPPEGQAELGDLRREMVFDSLPTALFLDREPAESAARRLEPVLPLVSPQEKAHLLATLAEREMKEASDNANWKRVAEWVTEAASAVESGSDERARTYCFYQQAQYLRKRPNPRYNDAWRTYEKSKTAGKRAGEPRREGLALLRLIELERDLVELREDPSAWPVPRLVEVDAVVARLWPAQADALSLRILGRLQAVAAAVDGDMERKRERLTRAAQAFSTGVLSSRVDDRRFGEVCVEALKLDLQPTGNFLLAQQFLASFRFEIGRRLGIAIDLERPETGRDAISQWLMESALEGRSHG